MPPKRVPVVDADLVRKLEAMNAGKRRPRMSKNILWVTCDVCGRDPISAFHFRSVKGARDVCYPCYVHGLGKKFGPLYFMGHVRPVPLKNIPRDKPELCELSDDEARGVLKRVPTTRVPVVVELPEDVAQRLAQRESIEARPTSLRDAASPTVAKAKAPKKAGSKAAKAPARKPTPKPGKKAAPKRSARTARSAVSTSDSDTSSDTSTDTSSDSDSDSSCDEKNVPAPRRASAKAPPAKRGAGKKAPKPPLAMKSRPDAPEAAPSPAPVASTPLLHPAEDSAVLDDDDLPILPPAAARKAAPKAAKAPAAKRAAKRPPKRTSSPARDAPSQAAPQQPQPAHDETQPSSPTQATQRSTAEPQYIVENDLVAFFRGLPCSVQPVTPPEPRTVKTVSVADTQLSSGESAQVRDGVWATVAPGARVISIRIAPTLRGEGVWFSALIRDTKTNMVAMWHMPTGSDGASLGTPELKGVIVAGPEPIVAFEWLPLPIHNDKVLGFASLMKAKLLMSGIVPKEFPTSKYCTNRVCGLTPMAADSDQALDPVAMRWVATSSKDIGRLYLVVVFACTTVVVYSIVASRQNSSVLVLSPRNKFPPPRLSLHGMPEARPLAVGVKATGESYLVVAHGSIIMMIEGGTQLMSVAELSSNVLAVTCSPGGVYCALDNGASSYVRLNGREKQVAGLQAKSKISAVHARMGDVVAGTTAGSVGCWRPDSELAHVVSFAEDGDKVTLSDTPAFNEPPAAAAPRYAFHPSVKSPFARVVLACTPNGVILAIDAPPLQDGPSAAAE